MYVNYYDRVENYLVKIQLLVLLWANKNDGVSNLRCWKRDNIVASQYRLYLPTEQQLLEAVKIELENFDPGAKISK
jgi:hypothetical protein